MSATKFHTHTNHTGKILLLYTLISIFLDTELEVAACAPTDSEHRLAPVFSSSRLEWNFQLVGGKILTLYKCGLEKPTRCHFLCSLFLFY
jgi:hypothetical protein